MKHIRKFESYRISKKREEIIKESVIQVNDIYKVRTMVDIPQSLINAYVKKVKDNTGKNLRQFFGDVDIAEEIVKYVTLNGLDSDKIAANALMGGPQGQAQGQGQMQAQPEAQPQAQTQPQAQVEAQPQAQPQTQPQAQVQVQTETETQAQPQAQGQGEFEEVPQAQPQAQGQAQEETEEGEEGAQAQEETEEGEEELPL